MHKPVKVVFTSHASQRATERNWKAVPLLIKIKDQLSNELRDKVNSNLDRVYIRISSQKSEVTVIASLMTHNEECDEITIISVLPNKDNGNSFYSNRKILLEV